MSLDVLAESSPCVCKRDFSWRRILEPDASKNDPRNWLVVFGPGAADQAWQALVKSLQTDPPLIDYSGWGVLVVTTETPEAQLMTDLYRPFDCRWVRTLSDASGRVGPKFGVATVNGIYPIALLQVQDGAIVNRLMIPGSS
jgi:hypothetical protein